MVGGYSDRNGVNFRFVNGGINTTPTDVTVLFALDKGILSPIRQELGSFEEVREAAFSCSDYDDMGSNGGRAR